MWKTHEELQVAQRPVYCFLLYSYPTSTIDTLKKIYLAGLICLPSICKVERACVSVHLFFSEHLLFCMLQNVGEQLLSYRAIPIRLTQMTQKLGTSVVKKSNFLSQRPVSLGLSYLVFFVPDR